MPKKRTELDRVVDRAATIIQAQLEKLPVELAEKKLRELQQMADQNPGAPVDAGRTSPASTPKRSRSR